SGLALAGAVPFAGFFSKDEIIAEVFKVGGENPVYFLFGIIALLTALITAIYTGRQYAQIFRGEPRDAHLHEHAHESPAVMTIPLYILAAGAVFAGFLGVPHIPGVPEQLHAFTGWLYPVFNKLEGSYHSSTWAAKDAHHSVNWLLLGIGAAIGWIGWSIGRGMGTKDGSRAFLPESTSKLSLDAIYNSTFVRGGFGLAAASRWVDDKIIDGIVNGVGLFVGQISVAMRLTQTSFVRNYALAMALGAIVVIAYFVVRI
ncbi:MAG TPA: hypothetical protein VF719_00105, partial [Abditibacteriaceae bacterium]